MGGLFGSKAQKPTVVPLPTSDDTEQNRIRSQEVGAIQQRSGRSSTLLSARNTSSTSSGGTTAYGNTRLGQS